MVPGFRGPGGGLWFRAAAGPLVAGAVGRRAGGVMGSAARHRVAQPGPSERGLRSQSYSLSRLEPRSRRRSPQVGAAAPAASVRGSPGSGPCGRPFAPSGARSALSTTPSRRTRHSDRPLLLPAPETEDAAWSAEPALAPLWLLRRINGSMCRSCFRGRRSGTSGSPCHCALSSPRRSELTSCKPAGGSGLVFVPVCSPHSATIDGLPPARQGPSPSFPPPPAAPLASPLTCCGDFAGVPSRHLEDT